MNTFRHGRTAQNPLSSNAYPSSHVFLLPFAKNNTQMLTDNVRSKLSALSRRLEEIDRMLAAPETAADMNLFRDLFA